MYRMKERERHFASVRMETLSLKPDSKQIQGLVETLKAGLSCGAIRVDLLEVQANGFSAFVNVFGGYRRVSFMNMTTACIEPSESLSLNVETSRFNCCLHVLF